MSVTLANSGAKDRRALDFYPTPHEVTVALMEFLDGLDIPLNQLTCCEPACGDGHMSEILDKSFAHVESFDIRDTGYGSVYDYLSGRAESCDCLITNPPFADSENFIRKAMSENRRVVAMLLKSQYWHSKKRLRLFRQYLPSYVLPLTWRPDFYFGQKSGSPTMEVLWTVWVDGRRDTKYVPLEKPVGFNLDDKGKGKVIHDTEIETDARI